MARPSGLQVCEINYSSAVPIALSDYAPRWLISAAHAFGNNPGEVAARFASGNPYLVNGLLDTLDQVLAVDLAVQHPAADLVLIRAVGDLARPAQVAFRDVVAGDSVVLGGCGYSANGVGQVGLTGNRAERWGAGVLSDVGSMSARVRFAEASDTLACTNDSGGGVFNVENELVAFALSGYGGGGTLSYGAVSTVALRVAPYWIWILSVVSANTPRRYDVLRSRPKRTQGWSAMNVGSPFGAIAVLPIGNASAAPEGSLLADAVSGLAIGIDGGGTTRGTRIQRASDDGRITGGFEMSTQRTLQEGLRKSITTTTDGLGLLGLPGEPVNGSTQTTPIPLFFSALTSPATPPGRVTGAMPADNGSLDDQERSAWLSAISGGFLDPKGRSSAGVTGMELVMSAQHTGSADGATASESVYMITAGRNDLTLTKIADITHTFGTTGAVVGADGERNATGCTIAPTSALTARGGDVQVSSDGVNASVVLTLVPEVLGVVRCVGRGTAAGVLPQSRRL